MSKRLVLKLAVMMAVLGAMTLLQGCDDDGVVIGGAWAPAGFVLPSPPGFAPSGSAGGTATQTGSGAATQAPAAAMP